MNPEEIKELVARTVEEERERQAIIEKAKI